MIRKFLSAAAATAAFFVVAPVTAADLSVKTPVYAKAPVAPFSWAGFYIGGHAGFTSGSTAFADVVNPVMATAYITVGGTDRFTVNRTGFVGGAQAGYNWQVNSVVFGVEGDLGYLGGNASQLTSNAAGEVAGDVRGGLYGSVRGRLGFAADRLLLFVTGGVIGVDDGARVTDQFVPTTLYTNRLGFRAGWTAGGGGEFALSKKWSMKADYLYYDLGTSTVTGEMVVNGVPQGAPNFYSWRARSTGHIGRIGVNYHFGG